MVKINGKEYAWGDIKIIMWGRPVVGATAIDYKLTKEKKLLQLRAIMPRAYSTASVQQRVRLPRRRARSSP